MKSVYAVIVIRDATYENSLLLYIGHSINRGYGINSFQHIEPSLLVFWLRFILRPNRIRAASSGIKVLVIDQLTSEVYN